MNCFGIDVFVTYVGSVGGVSTAAEREREKEGVEVTVVKNAVGSETEVKFGAFETTGPIKCHAD
jgi:hypothetical protein